MKSYPVFRYDVDALKTILCFVCSVELPKSDKVRISDWERTVLSQAQLEYAAHDAIAGRYSKDHHATSAIYSNNNFFSMMCCLLSCDVVFYIRELYLCMKDLVRTVGFTTTIAELKLI